MRVRDVGCIAVLAILSVSNAVAAGHCTLQKIGSLPVDMQGLEPIVRAKINGAEVRFVLDSGSFYSFIWRDAATRYQLPISPVPGGSYYISSAAGGTFKSEFTTVKLFELLGMRLSNIRFLVVNGASDDPVGLMGQNVLHLSDVEYDLASGILRFFKPVDCDRQPLAYWAVNTPYTSVELQNMYESGSELETTVIVNGRRMTAWLDTGSPRSFLTLDAAARIGITPTSSGVTFLGTISGLEERTYNTWIAPVKSFQLGGEKVTNAHLLIARYESRDGFPDMILGDDFFLSHRIYVAYGQNKIYFTYNGGPLFNLNLPQVMSGKEKPPATVDANGRPNSRTDEQAPPSGPPDASGLRGRGLAYASAHEFDLALADLTRACELSPTDPENYYDRGRIYEQDNQLKPALKDFDAAIRLQPDDIHAHLARAQLLQAGPNPYPAATKAEIEADLDAVSRLAAPDASVRLLLGNLYAQIGDYGAAIAQSNQWLDRHPLNLDQALGLNHRCWLRATANRDLHQALDDCNRAINLARRAPDYRDSRGLVDLRLGNFESAASDYDSALGMDPNKSFSLYGRGLAELRLGKKAQGERDLAAAEKLDSGIAQRFAKMGLAP